MVSSAELGTITIDPFSFKPSNSIFIPLRCNATGLSVYFLLACSNFSAISVSAVPKMTRALLTNSGTGKIYASALAMRELGFKRVLFLVHRVTLAKQAKKSFEKVFDKKVTMGLVGARNARKEDNRGRMQPITKVTMKMHHPVREDLLRYLQSNITA